ncbi:hypothetical protein BC828DRAFT_417361, partial [Blastocladiella britannica]
MPVKKAMMMCLIGDNSLDPSSRPAAAPDKPSKPSKPSEPSVEKGKDWLAQLNLNDNL